MSEWFLVSFRPTAKGGDEVFERDSDENSLIEFGGGSSEGEVEVELVDELGR